MGGKSTIETEQMLGKLSEYTPSITLAFLYVWTFIAYK